ncbi:MAG: helix-turn-helix domain-containing protein [Tenericutes bacterium]|jgi:hypothetical protein|nr:helix-turn-helix domain-containing protein [Mycoplasmatota bacterium]
MIYHIYIYQNKITEDLVEIFDKLSNNTEIHLLNDNMLKISMSLSVNEELVDFNMIHASIVSDFNVDTKLLYIHEKVLDFIPEEVIFDNITLLNHRAYDVTSFIIELGHYRNKRDYLKKQFVGLLGQDYIKTILMIAKSNMNFSITAKKLFLHRNSLNYRLDKIKNKTDINVKTFRGLRAFVNIFDE